MLHLPNQSYMPSQMHSDLNSPPKDVFHRPPPRHCVRTTRAMTHEGMVLTRTSRLAMFTHGLRICLCQIRTFHVLVLGPDFLVVETEHRAHRGPRVSSL